MRALRRTSNRAESGLEEGDRRAPLESHAAGDGVEAVLAEATMQLTALGAAADLAAVRIRAALDAQLERRSASSGQSVDLVADLAGTLLERTGQLAREAHQLEAIVERASAGLAAHVPGGSRSGGDER